MKWHLRFLYPNIFIFDKMMPVRLGAIFILRKDIGVGGPDNGNFPLLYVLKMTLCRWVGGSKSLKTPLRKKNVPLSRLMDHLT